MFVTFFHALKHAGLPVTLKEYLTLLEGLDADLAGRRIDDFYFLSRACLVKDERHLDRFDRVFGHVFKGLEALPGEAQARSPRSGCASSASSTLPRRTRSGSPSSAVGRRSWRRCASA